MVVVCSVQERGGVNSYTHGNLTLQFKMDNELDIIYVVSPPPSPTSLYLYMVDWWVDWTSFMS